MSRRAPGFGEAARAYSRALELCSNPVEKRYLDRRLAEVTGRGSGNHR